MPPATGLRILLVDDHPVVRHGLCAAIDRQPDMAVVGVAATLREALSLCRANPPDVLLLDLRLPDASAEQAVAQLHAAHPAARILLLGTDEAGEDLCRALETGAAGCVLRTAEMEEIVEAIRSTHGGAAWMPPEVAERWSAYRARTALHDAELVCLRLLAAGKNSPQIAGVLGWSERQVQARMRRIQKKLGARNETHMLVMALRLGIVSLE
jgi:DNA-binding NarL/FixJ family response regulator